jgi:SAM-dependent methyltransferase
VNSVRQAFDRHATNYDRVFRGGKVRSEVWQIADRAFFPGMKILDIGCGTGDDALHFVGRGVNVTAIDISPEMIAQLRQKAKGKVQCEVADMRSFNPPDYRFDGVFSNFCALNCVSDLDWLKRLPLASGGHVVLTLMGRFYPLETAVALLKRNLRVAFRRLGPSSKGIIEGVELTVYFHSIRAIQRALGNDFELVEVRGLRSLMPAPRLEHLERFSFFRLLEPMDKWICAHRLTAVYADHFVASWRYREA